MPDVECGFLICKGGNRLVKGPVVCGGPTSVTIPMSCPEGTRPWALTHTHLSGNPVLSETDKQTGRTHGISFVCTKTAKYGTRCYRIKR